MYPNKRQAFNHILAGNCMGRCFTGNEFTGLWYKEETLANGLISETAINHKEQE